MARSSAGAGIPVPRAEVKSLALTAIVLKERVEVLSREVGDILDGAVTFKDLITLGLITQDQLAEIERRDRQD